MMKNNNKKMTGSDIMTSLGAAMIMGVSVLGAAASAADEMKVKEEIMCAVSDRTPLDARRRLFDLYVGVSNKDLTPMEARDRLRSIYRMYGL